MSGHDDENTRGHDGISISDDVSSPTRQQEEEDKISTSSHYSIPPTVEDAIVYEMYTTNVLIIDEEGSILSDNILSAESCRKPSSCVLIKNIELIRWNNDVKHDVRDVSQEYSSVPSQDETDVTSFQDSASLEIQPLYDVAESCGYDQHESSDL
jgi:hypothetical protein